MLDGAQHGALGGSARGIVPTPRALRGWCPWHGTMAAPQCCRLTALGRHMVDGCTSIHSTIAGGRTAGSDRPSAEGLTEIEQYLPQ